MSLLAPLGLLGLLSVPVLLWLWRKQATRRQTRIASLVPFEHLQQKQPHKRSRLKVNLLFWLQLAACGTLALALAQPLARHAAAKTTLIILDTSASMGARTRGGTVYEQGLRALTDRLRSRSPLEKYFVVASAPVMALTPQPVGSAADVEAAAASFRPQATAGSLTAAAQIGQALLGYAPNHVVVVTDEPPPDEHADNLEWIRVGGKLPNAAIVGLDSEPALCEKASGLVAVVANFSEEPSRLRVRAMQAGRVLDEQTVDLEPGKRSSIALSLPQDIVGTIRVELDADPDALDWDNAAEADVRSAASMPVALSVQAAPVRKALQGWLNACKGLGWSETPPEDPAQPFMWVTDQVSPSPRGIGSVLVSPEASEASNQAPVYWLVDNDHPVGRYLAPIEPAGIAPAKTGIGEEARPIIWAMVRGERVPVVAVREEEGRRTVVFNLRPRAAADSSQALVAFLNSLRWIMSGTGRSAAAFLDPLESNLSEPASTWTVTTGNAARGNTATPVAGERTEPQFASLPLLPWLLWAAVLLLLVEWGRYTLIKGRAPVPPPPAPPS